MGREFCTFYPNFYLCIGENCVIFRTLKKQVFRVIPAAIIDSK